MREVIRIVIMVAVLLTVVLGVCLIVSAKDKQEPEEKTGYIFIGDSRTTGMNDAVHMDLMDDTFVVAKNDVEKALKILKANGEDAYVIGEIIKSEDKIKIC